MAYFIQKKKGVKYDQTYPHNSKRPVVCFDERPCQLLGDVLMPILMKPGRVEREDYHYERNGTAVVLMAVEPLAGQRTVKVTEQKTKKIPRFRSE